LGALQWTEMDEPGLVVQFEAWVERLPRDYVESVTPTFAGTVAENGRVSVRRVIRDNFRNVQAAYEISIEPDPKNKGYRATFERVPDSESPRLPRPDWKTQAPASLPSPQLLHKGDVLKLVVLDRPAGSQVAEYIRLADTGQETIRKEPPRDSFSDDAQFHLVRPRVNVNGSPVPTAPIAELQIALARVRVPGHGDYVLSLQRRPEFACTGEISGNSLTFQADGDVIRIEAEERIGSGSAPYNVYVFRDPAASGAESGEASIVSQ
jgi:hypothetical protein